MSDGDVLVIDDDPDIREALRMILEVYGIPARTAADPHRALIELRDEPPGVVLLDMRMPELSGEEFLEAMRELGLLGRIPVVVLSGDTTARSAAQTSGADAFLAKPVDVQDLLHTLARFRGQPFAPAP